MGATKVGKDALLSKGGVFHQALRDLRKQQEALDRQLSRVEKRFLKIKEASKGEKKKYVARMGNTTILRDAIRKSMVFGRKTTMPQILKALEKKDLYHTQSGYFYTMVNNKLNRDPWVKKVSRGIFVLQKNGQRRRRKAS